MANVSSMPLIVNESVSKLEKSNFKYLILIFPVFNIRYKFFVISQKTSVYFGLSVILKPVRETNRQRQVLE